MSTHTQEEQAWSMATAAYEIEADAITRAFEGVRKESCERGILRGRVAAADLEACEQGVRIERSRTVALQQSGELCDQAVEQLRLVMVEPQAQSALRKGEQSHCAPACRTVAHNP